MVQQLMSACTLLLQQHLNPTYFGDSTPNVDKHLYKVTKVTNSVTPLIGTELTRGEADEYCLNDNWKVVIFS